MIVTDFISKVRLVLDDVADTTTNPVPTYTDAEIVDHGQEQMRQLARVQAQQGKGFYNFTMAVRSKTSGPIIVTQVMNSVFQYTLPPWVMQIAGVWQINDTQQTSFSPYLWTNNELPLAGMVIPRWNRQMSTGYSFDDRRNLRLYGFSNPISLLLNVAKLPPRWFKATLDFPGAASGMSLYLPTGGLALGTEDIDEGAYINADIQITSSATIDKVGATRRCIYSKASTSVAGVRRHELLFANGSNWPTPYPAAGDVVETVLPIAEEHTRLPILLTANACFEKKGNLIGQKAIAPEIQAQTAAFREFASQQDSIAGPYYWQSSAKTAAYNPDKVTQYRPSY